MQTVEFNEKYARILRCFSLLRVHRAMEVKWGIKSTPHLTASVQLFLYLRTLMRYVPGINLEDCDIDIVFKNALTIVSGFSFLEYENVALPQSNYMDNCSCECGLGLDELQAIVSGSKKPAPFSIFYNDIRWNDAHTTFTEPTWSGLQFKVMSNTDNRFLNVAQDGFTILEDGGFSITNGMYDGQEFIPVF